MPATAQYFRDDKAGVEITQRAISDLATSAPIQGSLMIINKAGDEQGAGGAREERVGEDEKISAKRARSEFRSTTSERSEEKNFPPPP